jgi:tRNA(Ile)-lysidine synthase
VVAYSGGCDSHSLLHALVQIREQLDCQNLLAIHVDHGLQTESSQWSGHCEKICQQYAVPFQLIALKLVTPKGESPEAYARQARYAAMQDDLDYDDMLLLAQHQDDQAETLLLQLLRGSGVRGLAAMPEINRSDRYWQARPWLHIGRTEIQSYAEQAQLNWIDDPSNQDNRFDRNYLRNEIMPLLKQRWPAAAETLGRTARHQAEASELVNTLAELDWRECRLNEKTMLSLPQLKRLTAARQRNLLRYWIAEQCDLPLPDSIHCQRIIEEVLPAAQDAEPVVSWGDIAVRRYRDVLHIEKCLSTAPAEWRQQWDLQAPLSLPSGQTLRVTKQKGQGLALPDGPDSVTVGFRQGGEKCRLPGRQHRHELKKLFQNWGVPPWQRDRVPLIYVGNELAQVVGYSVCEPFLAKNEQIGYVISLA